MKYIFLILLFFATFFKINAQNLTFEKLGIQDGLPHDYVLCVFADSKGFLWIGTIGGLVKYDGQKMKTFSVQDGLSSNIIYAFEEDNLGNIWISTDKGISKYKNGTISSYFLDEKQEQSEDIYFSSKKEILVANQEGLFVYNLEIDSFIKHPLVDLTNVNTIVEDTNNVIWIGTQDGLFKIGKDSITKMFIHGPREKYHNSITSSLKDCYGNLWFGSVSGFSEWKKDSFYVYNQNIGNDDAYLDLIQLKDSSFLFGTYGGGIVSFINPKKTTRQKMGKTNVAQNIISGITQTKEGVIWLATGGGLLKSKNISFYEKKQFSDSLKSNIYNIKKDYDGNYWLATEKGLKKYNTHTNELEYFTLSETFNENFIISIYVDNESECIYFGTYGGKCYRYKNNIFQPYMNEDYQLDGQSIFGITKDSDNYIWISKTIRVIKCKNNKYEKILLNQNGAIYETIEDKNKTIWFAGSFGISYMKNDSIYHIKTIDNVNLEQIKHIEIDKNNVLWAGANGSGIFRYENGEGKQITTKDGLTSNFIQSLLYVEDYNQLWAGTINGISKISLDENSNITGIQQYTNLEILTCNDFALYYDKKDGILIGIGDKIYNYNPNNDKPNTNMPIVRLENIQLFNRDFDFTNYCEDKDSNNLPQNLVLPFDKNHITFNYYGIEFNQPKDVMYSLKLEGFDTDWSTPNKEHSITYTNLLPNDYTFKLKAKNGNGLWSTNFEYSFTIDAPFYKKWWFIGGILLLIFIIIYGLINRKTNKIKATAQIEKNIAELELKALRAQMNPHFIFNIMNNIQNFVINQNTNKAIALLGEFADLIRNILDISSDKTIVLSKEVHFLTTYINLDLTQYPEKYTYNFNFSDNIDQDNILLPPMLIQPFVENAILHGLMHKTEHGTLNLTFTQTNNTLICEIEDNGVGREKSKTIAGHKKTHDSKALNISNERIKQFNTIHNSDLYDIQIIDLKNSNNEAIGTKVIVKLPLILKY